MTHDATSLIADVRARHFNRLAGRHSDWCIQCEEVFPCTAYRLADALEDALRACDRAEAAEVDAPVA